MAVETQGQSQDGKIRTGEVPAGAFAAIPAHERAWVAVKAYPPFSGVGIGLKAVMEGLGGITPYKLGQLLGMPHPHNVYSHWLSGDSRPSPLYCWRMIWLLLMKQDGVNFAPIGPINWETGEVTLKRPMGEQKGDKSYKSTATNAKQAVQAHLRDNRRPVSQFLDESP